MGMMIFFFFFFWIRLDSIARNLEEKFGDVQWP